MKDSPRITVIVPNYNGAATLGLCLEKIFASDHDSFEVVVADDASTDGSREVARQFPCRLVTLKARSGTGRARTQGALSSSGEILFFTDSDCLLQRDTLRKAEDALRRMGENVVVGGTYTPVPYDKDFFSLFQSVFIHHAELRAGPDADYVAGHAMAISARTFWKTGGFPDNQLPILEDVEYSHRLKKLGYRLVIRPDILVRHIFNFSLFRSLRNGWRKSFYWTRYSLSNRDLCADSGTASRSLKTTVGLHALSLLLLLLNGFMPPTWVACLGLATGALVLRTNRSLLHAFLHASGPVRAGLLFLYYSVVYPFCIEAGAIPAYVMHVRQQFRSRQARKAHSRVRVPVRAETGKRYPGHALQVRVTGRPS